MIGSQAPRRNSAARCRPRSATVTGDHKNEFEGHLRETEGKGQNAVGQAKDAVRSAANTVSDTAQDAYNNPDRYVGQAKDALNSAASTAKDVYNNPDRYVGPAKDALNSAASTAKDAYNNPDRYVDTPRMPSTMRQAPRPTMRRMRITIQAFTYGRRRCDPAEGGRQSSRRLAGRRGRRLRARAPHPRAGLTAATGGLVGLR